MINKAEVLARSLLSVLLLFVALLPARVALSAEKTPFTIAYLQLSGDPRYEAPRAYAGIEVRSRHRPFDGAAIAVRGSRIIGRALGLKFSLQRATAETTDGLMSELNRLNNEENVKFFLVDASADVLTTLSKHVRGRDILLFNVSAPDDVLRSDACAANVMHTVPSRAMRNDALAQFMIARRWKHVLVLKGEFPEDTAIAEAFLASARKYGLSISEVRDFVLGSDPRQRHKNNIALLTSGVDYDAVFVADSLGQVGRYVAYQTALPRPVVGSEGLIAEAWHWTWERHGAPQLNQRFERKINRHMGSKDWAAWVAVKAIVEALARSGARSGKTDFKSVSAYLKSPKMVLDGYKGLPMSFRSWDNQLRQPILIHTHNAVIGRAPLDGFLHQKQYMDTLGYDAPENRCRIR